MDSDFKFQVVCNAIFDLLSVEVTVVLSTKLSRNALEAWHCVHKFYDATADVFPSAVTLFYSVTCILTCMLIFASAGALDK